MKNIYPKITHHIIGKAVIEPLKYFSFNLPHRSNIETWILDISEKKINK